MRRVEEFGAVRSTDLVSRSPHGSAASGRSSWNWAKSPRVERRTTSSVGPGACGRPHRASRRVPDIPAVSLSASRWLGRSRPGIDQASLANTRRNHSRHEPSSAPSRCCRARRTASPMSPKSDLLRMTGDKCGAAAFIQALCTRSQASSVAGTVPARWKTFSATGQIAMTYAARAMRALTRRTWSERRTESTPCARRRSSFSGSSRSPMTVAPLLWGWRRQAACATLQRGKPQFAQLLSAHAPKPVVELIERCSRRHPSRLAYVGSHLPCGNSRPFGRHAPAHPLLRAGWRLLDRRNADGLTTMRHARRSMVTPDRAGTPSSRFGASFSEGWGGGGPAPGPPRRAVDLLP